MGTTDPHLAIAALNFLSDAGVRYAMLHGRERLLQGDVTDVDLVVETKPDVLIAQTKAAFGSTGLFPVVVWPYDLAETRTVWYARRDASDAAQLDFLHDVNGLGHLGVRSAGLLASASQREFPPSISEEAELVYLWRKRVWKRQEQRLTDLARAAAAIPRAKLIEASITVTGSPATAEELLGERTVPRRRIVTRRPVLMALRNGGRMRRPVGYWMHVPHELLALNLAGSFGQFLPRAAAGRAPSAALGDVAWFWRSVQPIRLRPGVYVSYGQLPKLLRPDLIITGNVSAASACAIAVEAMSARI